MSKKNDLEQNCFFIQNFIQDYKVKPIFDTLCSLESKAGTSYELFIIKSRKFIVGKVVVGKLACRVNGLAPLLSSKCLVEFDLYFFHLLTPFWAGIRHTYLR